MDPETWKTALVFLQHGCNEQPFPNAQPLQPVPRNAQQGLAEAMHSHGSRAPCDMGQQRATQKCSGFPGQLPAPLLTPLLLYFSQLSHRKVQENSLRQWKCCSASAGSTCRKSLAHHVHPGSGRGWEQAFPTSSPEKGSTSPQFLLCPCSFSTRTCRGPEVKYPRGQHWDLSSSGKAWQ